MKGLHLPKFLEHSKGSDPLLHGPNPYRAWHAFLVLWVIGLLLTGLGHYRMYQKFTNVALPKDLSSQKLDEEALSRVVGEYRERARIHANLRTEGSEIGDPGQQ